MKNNKPFKSYLTFRKKKNDRHPHLIVDADKNRFNSMKLTHSSKQSHENNFSLNENPNPKDVRHAYLRKDLIYDYKFNYHKKIKNYKLPSSDYTRVDNYLKSKKNKIKFYNH